ncbi:MAG: ATP-binding cassette domain-containing protein [Planctomycetes bacterium]|nr:ATP-binding cassette domain-containing protein [Planctomycetota bacterium]
MTPIPASPAVVLDARDVVCEYGDRRVLDRVSLAVRRGEIHVILGGSGCGKSTLLRHAIGLERPKEGSVGLFGRDLWSVDEWDRELLLTRVGVLFQSGGLFNSLTVGENVAFPLRERRRLSEAEVRDAVLRTLWRVGLEDAARRMPSQLSGGMKKRAGLARALVLEPEIVFCDEPSAGLDPITSADLDALLVSLKRTLGITFVVVTHELPSVESIADRITVLKKGHQGVVTQGTWADLQVHTDPWVHDFVRRIPSRSVAS